MRLFTAIDLPVEMLEKLGGFLARLRPLAKLRWTQVENLHITTKFIGEWPEARMEEMKTALGSVTGPGRIDIAVRSAGWFPDDRRPHTFWAGVEGGEALAALARATERAVGKLGVPVETRVYSPHLTLARVKDKVRIDDVAASARHPRFRDLPGDCILLVFIGQWKIFQTCGVSSQLMTGLLVIVIAYLIGGIPFGYLLVRLTTGKDVRSSGSGNIGATNVLRTTGRAAGLATLLLDVAKGFFAVWLAAKMTDADPLWMSLAALAVMAGHAFPVFLKFQGGKAVASFIGAFLYLTPLPLAAVLVLFVITVAATRAISVGSIMAAGTFPLGVWLILHPPAPVLIASLIAGAFIVYRHKSNMERLHAGTENRFTWFKK